MWKIKISKKRTKSWKSNTRIKMQIKLIKSKTGYSRTMRFPQRQLGFASQEFRETQTKGFLMRFPQRQLEIAVQGLEEVQKKPAGFF